MKINNKANIHIKAYAKINLGLKVGNKRKDGYHEIETIFLPVSLYDNILIEKTEQGVKIESSESFMPVDDSNLAAIAFKKMKERFSSLINGGIKISIEKNIPIGGGLGGGSSDAAAVLNGVCSLWGFETGPDILKEIAGEIGSDVPFFIDCKTAYASGRGEILKEIDFSLNKWIVLVCPGINVSSGWAYREYKPSMSNENNDIINAVNNDIYNLKNSLYNDLEVPVFREYPVLKEIKENLYSEGAEYALMSGSGSTVYGVFNGRDESERVKKLFERYGDVYVVSQVVQ